MTWDAYFEDLQDLAEALSLCEPTERTANSLRRINGHIRSNWIVNKKASTGNVGIEIPPPRVKAIHPRLSQIRGAELRFNFELGENIGSTAMPRQADFQVKVDGYLEARNSVVALEDHWRVDSHMFPEIEKTREPHPYFHFQRGGHAQELFADDVSYVPSENMPDNEAASWKALMQSPSPRIATFPYCPILAIDFAISQHDGDVWRRLRSESSYRSVIERSQERLWTPFIAALSRPEIRRLWMGPVFI